MSQLTKLYDRAVGLVSPKTAAKNKIYRALSDSRLIDKGVRNLANGSPFYRNNRRGRSLGEWRTREQSANEDLRYSLADLRNDSNDLVLNNAISSGAIDTFCTNVVGVGLKLNSVIDWEFLGMTEDQAQAWQTNTEREWKLFCKNCDITRTRSMPELQELVFRSMLVNGDVLANLPMKARPGAVYDLCINLIEGQRMATPPGKSEGPRMAMGVEMDAAGQPTQYHIKKGYGFKSSKDFHELRAFDDNGNPLVLHIFKKKRVDQIRGIPLLSPIIEIVKNLDTYTHAEVQAAVLNSFFTVFIKKKTQGDNEDPLDVVSRMGNETGAKASDDDLKLASGTIIELLDDEEGIETADPTRPNVNFGTFLKDMVGQIAVGLNIPYEVLMKAFQSSYSASKGAVIEAEKVFDQYEQFLIDAFCQPVYESFLMEGIANGRISAPGFFSDPLYRLAYCGAEWVGPGQNELDPFKAAKASQQRMKNGTSNEFIETARQGRDFETVARGAARARKVRDDLNLNDIEETPTDENA